MADQVVAHLPEKSRKRRRLQALNHSDVAKFKELRENESFV